MFPAHPRDREVFPTMGSASIFAGGLGRLRASGWWILTSHLSLTTGPNNPFPLRTGSASSTAPSTETVGDPGAGATAATGSAEPGAGANAWPGAGESSTEVDIAPTAPQKNNKVRIVARPQIIDCIPFTTAPKYPKKAAPAAAKPKKDREAPEEGKKAAPVAAKSKKEAAKEAKAAAPAPPPPARRKPGPPHEAKEAAEAKGSDDAPQEDARPRHRHKHPAPVEISSSSSDEGGRAPEPKAKAERKRARPTDPDDFSPEAARQVLQSVVDLVNAYLARHPPPPPRSPSNAGLFDLSVGKVPRQEGPCAAELHRPCPSLARPLAYERLGAIVEWFEKLGAAVLFSIIVQTSALDEARYQVVDGSHRFQVARIIVDPRRGGEAQQATPQIRQHLKEDYIDVAVYNTLDPEAMLELQHRVNLLTHDARFGSSTFDVLLNLKRASLQAPKRYIRAALPKGEDAPAKLVKILECFSLEMLCALSQLPVERQPSATNLWRIFEARDAEMNRWLARAMLEGSFSGSEATSTAAADLKKPIRQAEQTFMLLEAHDAAEVAAGDHPPVLYLPPDEAAREILRCHLVRTETFAFMNCLNVRPFPFRKAICSIVCGAGLRTACSDPKAQTSCL
ncbi:hypothetical protein PAPYR_10459 [Paratrimastix pyriformis]|uniref:ParB/Sulfiredoxin domain-containing protein n=1 Tax=Paratrimastix pyriformis TaxID=342808 RepID=A0ABQ8U5Z5_9EUKA|nr:hypothetical protein PAPYR_10459 [Paratrimastix pyriformis]